MRTLRLTAIAVLGSALMLVPLSCASIETNIDTSTLPRMNVEPVGKSGVSLDPPNCALLSPFMRLTGVPPGVSGFQTLVTDLDDPSMRSPGWEKAEITGAPSPTSAVIGRAWTPLTVAPAGTSGTTATGSK